LLQTQRLIRTIVVSSGMALETNRIVLTVRRLQTAGSIVAPGPAL
jgi:hypothetical protein